MGRIKPTALRSDLAQWLKWPSCVARPAEARTCSACTRSARSWHPAGVVTTRTAGEMAHAPAATMPMRWPRLDILSLSMEGGRRRVLTGAVAR
jgi:hypothetical protein